MLMSYESIIIYVSYFGGMAWVQCGCCAGTDPWAATWCGCVLGICIVGRAWVTHNWCSVVVGQHPQLRGGYGSEFPTHAGF